MYGLVLVADRVEQRRVLDGWLGCANCRERYRIQDGYVELRYGPAPAEDVRAEQPAQPADAVRLAALLGVTEGPALLLVVGTVAVLAPALVELIEGIEVMVVSDALRVESEKPGVSRFAHGTVLPFRSGSVRAIALTGGAEALIDEAARVVAAGGRVVVLSGGADVQARVERSGLRVVARDERALIGERTRF
ncbi:MAG: hypothetical protein ACT443_13015 [Gemmatimonadota bacterium]